jgi:hypothetical protein
MIMIFTRTVLRDYSDPNKATVFVRVSGSFDGMEATVGNLTFPSTQAWAKFWGAVHHGALKIPDLEVKMENAFEPDPDALEVEKQQQVAKQQEGEQLGNPDAPRPKV